MLKTASLFSHTAKIHNIRNWVPWASPYKHCRWFSLKCTSYDIYSFQMVLTYWETSLEVFFFFRVKWFWITESGLIFWYFDIHKLILSKSCCRLCMDVPIEIYFSAGKNILQKTVVQKLILPQNWHSPVLPCTYLSKEERFQKLPCLQTYYWSNHVSERYFNRNTADSSYDLIYHFNSAHTEMSTCASP